jgi:hypothetical protein
MYYSVGIVLPMMAVVAEAVQTQEGRVEQKWEVQEVQSLRQRRLLQFARPQWRCPAVGHILELHMFVVVRQPIL